MQNDPLIFQKRITALIGPTWLEKVVELKISSLKTENAPSA